MRNFSRIYSHVGLMLMMLALLYLAGCSVGSKVEWDKAAMQDVKKVAVVVYSVPPSIRIRDNPRESVREKKSVGLADLAKLGQSVASSSNGPRAAELAHKTFIKFLNQQNLSFKAITANQMRSNSAFTAVAAKTVEKQAQAAADAARKKAEEDKKKSGAMKALSFLGGFGGGSKPSSGPVPAASPAGIPNFGLAPDWRGSPSALLGAPGETEYIKGAIKALGVDAAIVVNDPGYSWGCETCIANTGNASTQAAFLISIVDPSGEVILDMRQWFAIGGGNAVMAAGIINPLQYDSLYEGHGEKTARVFADYYKEEGGK